MTAARVFATFSALAVVAACAPVPQTGAGSEGTLARLPEAVHQLAAPHQDLSAVRIMPEDGCYWYRHVGPVETTYLPLRTVDGRPICSRPA